jgi:hypothetical protein
MTCCSYLLQHVIYLCLWQRIVMSWKYAVLLLAMAAIFHPSIHEGEDINPPLEVTHIPDNTKSLALVVEDPDAPKGVYDHWIA